MSSTDFINELKELFGDRVWTRNDEDFLTTTKCEWLKNEYIECVIECEGDYDDLEYYEHYWGTKKFRILLTRSFVGRKTGRPSETPRSSKRAEPL